MSSEKPRGLTRRDILKGAVSAPFAGYAVELVHEAKHPLTFLDLPNEPRPYPSGPLRGKRLGGLLTSYTGMDGEVPKTISVDFRYQLAQLWKEKLARMRTEGGYPVDAVSTARDIVGTYRTGKGGAMTLNAYAAHVGSSLKEVSKKVDMDRITTLAPFSEFGDSQKDLLKALTARIHERSILAYALTEIMPTSGEHADVGVNVLEFLLQHAGPAFIESIPAMGDNLLSFGPFQFTGHALYRSSKERRGASLIDSLSSSPQIPSRVAGLRGEDHYKAAYLFAVYNLAQFVRDLGEDRSKKLLEHVAAFSDDLVAEYIAVAHHSPSNARDAFESYSDVLLRYLAPPSSDKRGRRVRPKKPDFLAHCKKEGVGEYCSKTRDNLEELGHRLPS